MKNISKNKYLKALNLIEIYKGQLKNKRDDLRKRNESDLKTIIKGDKVKCVYLMEVNKKHLTLDRNYEVLKVKQGSYRHFYWIRCDDNKLRYYSSLFTFRKV